MNQHDSLYIHSNLLLLRRISESASHKESHALSTNANKKESFRIENPDTPLREIANHTRQKGRNLKCTERTLSIFPTAIKITHSTYENECPIYPSSNLPKRSSTVRQNNASIFLFFNGLPTIITLSFSSNRNV